LNAIQSWQTNSLRYNKKMQPTPSNARVIIYSRPGCHLCDEAKQAIEGAGCQNEYTLEEINIESDPNLLNRYQYDIPVVTINGVEAFRHRLTAEEFRKRLRRPNVE
jgi:glutaredoxin